MPDDLELRLLRFGETLQANTKPLALERPYVEPGAGEPPRRPSRLAAAAVVVVLGLTGGLIWLQRPDPSPSTDTRPVRPLLGDLAVWPESSRLHDSATTPSETVRRFFSALGLTDVSVRQVRPGDAPRWVQATVGNAHVRVLVTPTQSAWSVQEVNDSTDAPGSGGLAYGVVEGGTSDHFAGGFSPGDAASVAWRDRYGMHYQETTVNAEGQALIGAKAYDLISAVVVTRAPSGAVTGVVGGFYGPLMPGPSLVTQAQPQNGSEQALFDGSLLYDPELNCVYLQGADSDERVLPVWPVGFRAAGRQPVRILDATGKVIAQPGDQLRSGGGYHAIPEGEPTCGVVPASDAAFVIGEIEGKR